MVCRCMPLLCAGKGLWLRQVGLGEEEPAGIPAMISLLMNEAK